MGTVWSQSGSWSEMATKEEVQDAIRGFEEWKKVQEQLKASGAIKEWDAPTTGPLIDRLGGPDAVKRVVEGFCRRMFADERLQTFLQDRDIVYFRAKQNVFMSWLFGPVLKPYTGKHLRVAHLRIIKQRGFAPEDYELGMSYFEESMRELGAPEKLVKEAVAKVRSLKDVIFTPSAKDADEEARWASEDRRREQQQRLERDRELARQLSTNSGGSRPASRAAATAGADAEASGAAAGPSGSSKSLLLYDSPGSRPASRGPQCPFSGGRISRPASGVAAAPAMGGAGSNALTSTAIANTETEPSSVPAPATTTDPQPSPPPPPRPLSGPVSPMAAVSPATSVTHITTGAAAAAALPRAATPLAAAAASPPPPPTSAHAAPATTAAAASPARSPVLLHPQHQHQHLHLPHAPAPSPRGRPMSAAPAPPHAATTPRPPSTGSNAMPFVRPSSSGLPGTVPVPMPPVAIAAATAAASTIAPGSPGGFPNAAFLPPPPPFSTHQASPLRHASPSHAGTSPAARLPATTAPMPALASASAAAVAPVPATATPPVTPRVLPPPLAALPPPPPLPLPLARSSFPSTFPSPAAVTTSPAAAAPGSPAVPAAAAAPPGGTGLLPQRQGPLSSSFTSFSGGAAAAAVQGAPPGSPLAPGVVMPQGAVLSRPGQGRG